MSQVSFYSQEHNKECPKYPMNCESCGKKKIQRDKVAIKVHMYSKTENKRLGISLNPKTFEK